MIDITNLGKSYGARVLFEEVSLKLVSGARYGLVGANGAGKTTFLEIVAGDDPPTEGSVNIAKTARVGVLRQDRFLRDEDPILTVAMEGDEIVSKAYAEQHRLVESGSPDAARLAELEDRIASHDGYTLEARATNILEGLGIPMAVHKNPLGTLSGGFKLRVLLAQVLLGGPDVLLLDEPTNHLDILSIRWLEKFLAGYTGCAMVISHDEKFLDTVATHILDVDYGTITVYPGNYAHFVREKAAIYERKAAEIGRAEAIVAEKKAWVERFGAKATKAKQAQSRLKQIEKIEVGELEQSTRRAPMFSFMPERPSGKDVLTVEHVSKAYGEKKVLKDVSLTMRRGEKVAVVGQNGLGKSTLLKIVTGVGVTGGLEPDDGKVRWGHETRVGYFPQDHHEILTDENAKPIDVVWDLVPAEATTYVRGQLGRMLFSGQDVEKRVGLLSGGEAARLVFCRIAVQKPNVLVLDEPTNHLDLESIHALTESLKAFEGAVLFVSHDRAFVSALATRVLEVTESGFHDMPGTYEEYLAQRGNDHLDAEQVVLRAKKEKKEAAAAPKSANGTNGTNGAPKSVRPPPANAGPPLSWEDQKKLKNRQKQLPALRDAAWKAVEAAELRKEQIHARWCEAGYYEKTPPTEIAALEAEEKALAPTIEKLMAEWDALEQEMK